MRILPDNRALPAFGKPQSGSLLAQDCLLCGGDSPAIICPACAEDLPQLPLQRCPRCALPTPRGEICGRCLATPPHFDQTRVAFRYDFPIDRLIQSFKYGHRLALSHYFGAQLAVQAGDTEADLIIPLPLHAERLRTRGFNQAMELARPVAKALGIPIDTQTCQRSRATQTQADLPWKERAKNVRHAFHCTADLTGRKILLIDDVMTTGASLDECARTLRLHGASRIELLVVARVLQD